MSKFYHIAKMNHTSQLDRGLFQKAMFCKKLETLTLALTHIDRDTIKYG